MKRIPIKEEKDKRIPSGVKTTRKNKDKQPGDARYTPPRKHAAVSTSPGGAPGSALRQLTGKQATLDVSFDESMIDPDTSMLTIGDDTFYDAPSPDRPMSIGHTSMDLSLIATPVRSKKREGDPITPPRTTSAINSPDPFLTQEKMPTLKHTRKGRQYKARNRRAYPAFDGYKHLAVFNDPFSNTTLTPRIPDGKSIVSTGLKYHFRETFELGGGAANTNEASIILTPSLTSPCAINYFSDSDNRWFVFSADDLATRNGSVQLTQSPSQEIYKWRVVGYGLHISLLSNTDNNAGWWEAGRISTLVNADEYHFYHADKKPLIVYPKHDTFDQESKTLINHPSYTTGRLRDIHNVTFQLLPDGNEHDFVTCSPVVSVAGASNAAGGTNLMVNDKLNLVQGKKFDTTIISTQDCIKSHVDFGWDSIFIRCYGTASSTPSQILVHVVQNVELVYDERATMARFQSRSPAVYNFDKISKNKSKQTASAKLVKNKKG